MFLSAIIINALFTCIGGELQV